MPQVLSRRQVGTTRERITTATRSEVVEFVKTVDSLRMMAVERLLTIVKEEERDRASEEAIEPA